MLLIAVVSTLCVLCCCIINTNRSRMYTTFVYMYKPADCENLNAVWCYRNNWNFHIFFLPSLAFRNISIESERRTSFSCHGKIFEVFSCFIVICMRSLQLTACENVDNEWTRSLLAVTRTLWALKLMFGKYSVPFPFHQPTRSIYTKYFLCKQANRRNLSTQIFISFCFRFLLLHRSFRTQQTNKLNSCSK